MSAAIYALQLSKHGIPPIVFISESSPALYKFWIDAQIAWPGAALGGGSSITKIIRLGFVVSASDDPAERVDTLKVARLAVKQAVLQFGAEHAAKVPVPVDEIALSEVDVALLRAWRSLGHFPALEGNELAAPARKLVAELDYPITFLTE